MTVTVEAGALAKWHTEFSIQFHHPTNIVKAKVCLVGWMGGRINGYLLFFYEKTIGQILIKLHNNIVHIPE